MKRKKSLKKFGGADVIRGLGMHHKKCDALECKALDHFTAGQDTWLVVADNSLEDDTGFTGSRCFARKEDAVRFARAQANGNVDHRVLRITDQILVVATDNLLEWSRIA